MQPLAGERLFRGSKGRKGYKANPLCFQWAALAMAAVKQAARDIELMGLYAQEAWEWLTEDIFSPVWALAGLTDGQRMQIALSARSRGEDRLIRSAAKGGRGAGNPPEALFYMPIGEYMRRYAEARLKIEGAEADAYKDTGRLKWLPDIPKKSGKKDLNGGDGDKL